MPFLPPVEQRVNEWVTVLTNNQTIFILGGENVKESDQTFK